VGYPIVKLRKPTELVGFVREIESGLIAVCNDLGLDARRVDGRSGVWIQDSQGDRKIAAIGVRVAQGVTMHGFALNVNPDLSAFGTIVPCGITDADVTSLEIELKKSITINDVTPLVERHIFESLKKVSA
jgi:lipoyl(octanoyl) transferase